MTKRWVLHAVLLLLGTGLCSSAYAQSSTVGSISGTVRDAQGGVVSGAEITVTEETTGQVRTATADEDGFYTVPSLPVGRYTVSTGAQGFKTTIAPAIAVNVSS